MKGIVALLYLLAAATGALHLGNDTDAVIARGLFPLGRDNPSLLLLAETVRVRLGPEGATTTRLYSVRNAGRGGRIRLATICGGPNVLDADCGEVLIGGAVPASRRAIGYLVDSGSFVSTRQVSRRAIEECLKTVDGTVCGHEWKTVSIDMQAGETREISLQYKALFDDRYWLESVVSQLYLYTEKFWSGDSIPRLGVWLELHGGKLELPTWMPRGQYAQYSTAPTAAVAGAIYWQLDGYKPVKKQYTYQFALLHSGAIDSDQIRKVYDKAMVQSGSVPR
jgi:hypothetical protein